MVFRSFSLLIEEAGGSSYNPENNAVMFPPESFYGKVQLDTKLRVSKT